MVYTSSSKNFELRENSDSARNKIEAVLQVVNHERLIDDVARELGVSCRQVYLWAKGFNKPTNPILLHKKRLEKQAELVQLQEKIVSMQLAELTSDSQNLNANVVPFIR